MIRDKETLDMLDKELFRKGKDNEVIDAYIEVYNRIMTDEEKELARLRRENRDLQDALEVLKKAISILND